ncbi:hypothetical protein CSPX01_00954 [Colletotrichum filicis]|nr:hypothetical protein CSPX01_00954 [Colletotrichum filicis]
MCYFLFVVFNGGLHRCLGSRCKIQILLGHGLLLFLLVLRFPDGRVLGPFFLNWCVDWKLGVLSDGILIDGSLRFSRGRWREDFRHGTVLCLLNWGGNWLSLGEVSICRSLDWLDRDIGRLYLMPLSFECISWSGSSRCDLNVVLSLALLLFLVLLWLLLEVWKFVVDVWNLGRSLNRGLDGGHSGNLSGIISN